MDNIIGQVIGGSKRIFDGVHTVGDVRVKMDAVSGFIASVNGEPEDDDYELDSGDYVSFAKSAKGGL